MNFYDEIWEILNEGEIELKFLKFELFYEKFKRDFNINFCESSKPNELIMPSYAKFCEVVSMKELNKKVKPMDKNLNFIHSVAHIEFSAIDIALDACYRFRNLPREFYEDWLEVAEDEIRHFCMIENLLLKQGGRYGELSVHDGLFIALQKTSSSLTSRMALLPRYMEANGLDANAHIIKRLEAEGGQEELIECLKVILKEEVSHVYKGDKWFKFACNKEGIDENSYFDIILSLYPNSFKNVREINEQDRLKAGFSKEELCLIKNFSKER
ncbi:ferritin [Campylobacter concisus]|uniref:ferritin-like domain-containing protein n=1 Tax=Campylobacter concisus TaxID=199 RepID=UPI000B3D5721|nr:ferritin-like domain-containing protein [Campylobacter concisus]OUT09797.1 ferritin [Campylobacter concisus]